MLEMQEFGTYLVGDGELLLSPGPDMKESELDEAEDPDFVPLEREELGGLEDEQEYELGRRCDLPGIAPYSQRNERMVASDNLTEF